MQRIHFIQNFNMASHTKKKTTFNVSQKHFRSHNNHIIVHNQPPTHVFRNVKTKKNSTFTSQTDKYFNLQAHDLVLLPNTGFFVPTSFRTTHFRTT